MKRYTHYFPVPSVFLLALCVRLVYNFTTGHNYIVKDDAALYNNLALGMLQQHCYCLVNIPHSNISRAPLWPLVIATIYFFTGRHELYPRLFYAMLGSGTCILVYLFARDLFGRRVALVAGLLAAIYTGLFLFDGWLFSESLYTFLSTLLVYSLYRVQHVLCGTLGQENIGYGSFRVVWRHTRGYLITAGVCLALASLTRPNGPVLFGLIALWSLGLVLMKRVSWRNGLYNALVLVGIAVVLIAPWTYRNYRVAHAFIPIAVGGGEVLVGAYNDTVLTNVPNTGPGFWVSKDLVRPPVHTLSHDDWRYTARDDKADIAQALHWIRTHPQDLPYLFGWHFLHLWSPYTFEPALPVIEHFDWLSSQIIWYMMFAMAIPVFLLAALGVLVTWKQYRGELLAVYLVVALTIAQNIAFYANIRFRAPMEPFLVLLVGGACWWFASRFVRARHTQPPSQSHK
jgi:4-amino-4-deoxy-L-arabinose transferase-like glycosyltransferase